MPLKTEAGLGSGDIALDGEPVPPKRHSNPHFSAHVYCRQRAGWIQMPFGTDLGPGHTVLDGNPAPPKRGIAAPIFEPFLLWSNGWVDSDATWCGSRPIGPGYIMLDGDIALDGDPAPQGKRSHIQPTERGTAAPHFSTHVYRGQAVPI